MTCLMPYCTYCGAEVKTNDKFCIYCGKPHITQSSNSAKKGPVNLPSPQKRAPHSANVTPVKESELSNQEAGKGTSTEEANAENESPDDSSKDKKDANKAAKKQVTETASSEETEESDAGEVATPVATELLPEVKEQIDIRLDLAFISLKKKKIAQKIADVSKLLEDPQYELDEKFQADVNAKIATIKEVKTELDQQKTELKGRIDENSSLTALPSRIKVLKSQIEDLKTNYKFHKIERDVFDQLNTEYSEELNQDLKTYNEILAAIKVLQVKIKAERHEQERDINFAKARLRSREITPQELDEQIGELTRQIERLDAKLKVIRGFLQKR